MSRLVSVSVASWLVLEALLAFVVMSSIGLLPLVAIVLAVSTVGALILRRQASAFVADAVATVQNRQLDDRQLTDGAFGLIGGLLLALPGLVSGLIGALLFLPTVRRIARPLVRTRARRWSSRSLWFGRNLGDVVDVSEAAPSPSGPGRAILGDPRGVH